MLPNSNYPPIDDSLTVQLFAAVEEFDHDLIAAFTNKLFELAEVLDKIKADSVTMTVAFSLPAVAIMAEFAKEVPIELRASTITNMCRTLYALIDAHDDEAARVLAGEVKSAHLKLLGLPEGTPFAVGDSDA